MAKENITIDDLAIMVQKGFAETATKAELIAVKDEMKEGFKKVNERLDKIEDVLIEKHDQRISYLEQRVRELGTALDA